MSRFIPFAHSTEPLLDLLRRETQKQKKIIEDLRKKPIEESLIIGDILGPLKVKEMQEDIGLVFKYKGFFSRYRRGDLVDVRIYSSQSGFTEMRNEARIIEVRFPEYGQIEVITAIRKNLEEFSPDKEYYFFPSDLSSINRSIYKKLQNIDEHIDNYSSSRNFPSIKISDEMTTERFFNNLNDSQKKALKILADRGLEGRIQGPPGTGKTHLLKAIVELALKQKFTIGIAAFTHAAVDNAFSRIVPEHNDKCIRVGQIEKIKKNLYGKNFEKMNTISSFYWLQEKYSVYANTMHSWALSSSCPKVDLLIIDEAGQVPIYFKPFLRRIGDRVIMLGDHKQLPPVLSVEVKDIKPDIFSEVEPDDMLEIQYRMNSDIQSWSSNRFYKNRLKPDESVAERDILSSQTSNNTLIGNSRVNLYLHSAASNSEYANASEAAAVAKQIKILENKGVPLNDIGVITPYRIQAGAVNAKIQEEYSGDVSVMEKVVVDTVERFQGQEREVILLSFGADGEKSKTENKVFLGDGRRLNVSVTRARSRFYCFSSKNLKDQKSERIPQESYLQDFLGWCDYMTSKREVA